MLKFVRNQHFIQIKIMNYLVGICSEAEWGLG